MLSDGSMLNPNSQTCTKHAVAPRRPLIPTARKKTRVAGDVVNMAKPDC
jgi:hypothetical protein